MTEGKNEPNNEDDAQEDDSELIKASTRHDGTRIGVEDERE